MAVTGIVTGFVPQLNVIIPPAAIAVFKAAKVQLAAVPFPITFVGFETLTGWAPAGSALLHEVGMVVPPGGIVGVGVGVVFDPFEELEPSLRAEFEAEPQLCSDSIKNKSPVTLKNEDPILRHESVILPP